MLGILERLIGWAGHLGKCRGIYVAIGVGSATMLLFCACQSVSMGFILGCFTQFMWRLRTLVSVRHVRDVSLARIFVAVLITHHGALA